MSATTVNKNSTAKPASGLSPQTRNLVIIGAVVAVALVGVVLIIALGGANTGDAINYAAIPSTRAADGAFVLGDPNAPITLIEFADFACPHCQSYHPTMQQFIREYVATGQARFEYRILPTTGREVSVFTGKLLECADTLQPGAFWRGKDLMYVYATTGRYNAQIGRQFAQDMGLNYSDLLTCTNNAQQVTIDLNLANSVGISGTPATMIRYGDGAPSWITVGTTTWDRGGAPLSAISTVVQAANASR
jgi:protein-disulfide isomerase